MSDEKDNSIDTEKPSFEEFVAVMDHAIRRHDGEILEKLHEFVPRIIARWEPKLQVRVSSYFLQRMKTKWGSCNHEAGHIRMNTELVKKPKDLVEYVVVHEMVHLIEPTHSDRFISILAGHYPSWREARAELNQLPLAAECWNE